MVGGKGFKEVEGVLGRFSPVDACLMEEASRYSIFSLPFVYVWEGRDFFSSPFSGMERALIEVEEGHDVVCQFEENQKGNACKSVEGVVGGIKGF